jgi:hypothetical protein
MCYWCEERKACLMCGKPLPNQSAPSSCTVDSIVLLIQDTAWAATFQTLGQYRQALLDAIRNQQNGKDETHDD